MEYNVELMSSVINLFVLGTTLFKKTTVLIVILKVI
jgi:hypothetical protein